MDRFPDNSRGDVQFWRLTPMQAARYHARLARMHADRSVALADRATSLATIAMRFAVASAVILVLTFVARIVAAVTS